MRAQLTLGEFTREQAVERFLPELRIATWRLRANDR